jgi:hypothetical protein
MNEKDREAVARAKRQQRKTNQQTTRTEETGEQAGQIGTNELSAIADQLSDNIVDFVWADALQKAFTRLSNGDMGKIAPKMLNAFGSGLNGNFQTELEALQEWHDPKYALPPSSESDG